MPPSLLPVPYSLHDLVAEEMTVHARPRPEISFPRDLFAAGTAAERTALFDAAYDLACDVLGRPDVHTHDDGRRIRFRAA